jgi:hypothetical protein
MTEILCPKCKSADTHAEKRGWSGMTGLIGSSKIVIICLACGKQFKPGHGWKESKASGSDMAIAYVVMFVIFIVVFLFLRSCLG